MIKLGRLHLVFLLRRARYAYRATCMPLDKVVQLQRFTQKYVTQPDPLFPRGTTSNFRRKTLRNPKLAALLKGTQLGSWSLATKSIDYLEEKIKEHHPRAILEFGSGISTLCLAFIMKELQGPSLNPLVFSIEQN